MTPTPKALTWAHLAVDACREKLATDIKLIDVSERIGITDIFVIATAQNDRQVRAIVDAVEEKLDNIDVDPLRREGEQLSRWVLLDYGDIVVHVQHTEERSYYELERLWKDCPELPLPEEKVVAKEG
ncbi:MAG: ribosome silencing factor [Candidatus Nanopelagicales bacterium]